MTLPSLQPALQPTLQPVRALRRVAWRGGRPSLGERRVPEEVAVAFTYNRAAYAVMMATPADLADFAIGFSLTERIIDRPGEIEEFEVVPGADGIELRMWVGEARAQALDERRRHLAGPTGCGLCGIESLEEAMRPPPPVESRITVAASDLAAAVAALPAAQHVNRQTHAVHAAGYWEKGAGLVSLREDVGRHNALDKLAGDLAQRAKPATAGIVVLTSRVSVEMVQKAAAMRAPVIVAVSAPTALAVRVADACGITLAAIAREDGFEVFSHPGRIAPDRVVMEAAAHVA
jgi:FdhD protein